MPTGAPDRPRQPSSTPWTESRSFVPTLHGVRGLAILVVVLYHVAGSVDWAPNWQPAYGLYESGFLAVDGLFFTTGFVLFLPILLDGTIGSLRAFAIKRWARLAPAYYVCLCVVAAMLPLLTDARLRPYIHRGPVEFLIHALFLQRELAPHDTGFIVDEPVWTLSIDACFYVLLPCIAKGFARWPLQGLLVGLVVAQLWRAAFIQPGLPEAEQHKLVWLVQMPFFAGDFVAGMAAAWLFSNPRVRAAAKHHVRACVTITGVAFAGLLTLAYAAGSNLPYALGSYQEPAWIVALFPLCLLVFVVAISLAPKPVQRPLTNRPLRAFTEISYSVYLYHYAVLFFAIFTLGIGLHQSVELMFIASVPATLVIATVSCLVVERPGRRWARRVTASLQRSRRRDETPISA